MLLGVGVDMLHLPRLSRIVSRYGKEKLAKRILSSRERTVMDSLLCETEVLSFLALR